MSNFSTNFFAARLVAPLLLLFATAFGANAADGKAPLAALNIPEEGSVSEAQGLAAFARIFEVLSHPRCANCHVGEDNIPMWTGPSYGDKQGVHGMKVNAGESRIGAETIPCATCHRTTTRLESEQHAPPHFGLDWRLAPVEFEWFGKNPAQICAQLKNPERNGGRDGLALAQHLVDDAGHRGPVLWGWSPGGNRQPAPYNLQQHVDDVLIWAAAGQPCPVS